MAANSVDGSVWRAVVGSAVQIPPVNSHVCYFPEGHLEHNNINNSSSANYDFTLSRRPFIPCQLISLRFLSDPTSDRPFVKMHLRPCHVSTRSNNNNVINIGKNDVVSFAKALTPSDANNGGGFSVPKFCAEMVFPRLPAAGCGGHPPSQDLTVRDAGGRDQTWRFRHIYRGTPRRHLVSTGWTRFVRAKRLVTGDAVVFMRKRSTGELFVGVRRARRLEADDGRRHGEVMEAARRAAAGLEFEVVYYPEFGSPDFVVGAEKVREALEMKWTAGMRVRMAADGDDFSRMAWFQGTVEATCFASPWRMLQVKWDEGEVGNKRVCPWQVEHIPLIQQPPKNNYFPPCWKKMKKKNNISSNDELDSTITRWSRPNVMHHRDDSIIMPFLGGIHGDDDDDIINRTIAQTTLMPNKDDRSIVSTALSIGGSGVVNNRCCFRLFGKNIVDLSTSDPIVVVGGGGTKRSAGCTYD